MKAELDKIFESFDGNRIPVIGYCTNLVGGGCDRLVDCVEAVGQPIKLAPGEGLAIRNLVVWPAAGTGVLTGVIKWEERTT